MNRRHFLNALLLVGLLLPATSALAGKPAVFTGVINGVAAGGYDVVAYQIDNAAKPGDAAIAAEFEGITYRFANEANRTVFTAEPAKYIPAYGGYCAYAVAKGYTASTDPEAFSVVGGRLYLNYSKSVQSKWQQDTAGNLASANGNWPKVLDK